MSAVAVKESAAAEWVGMFAKGWANPVDADSFCDHFDPWFDERVAYLDPAPLLEAVAASPRVWPRFIRAQLGNLRRPS